VDTFSAVFVTATSALLAALELQTAEFEALHNNPSYKFVLRIALHTDTVDSSRGDYSGVPINHVVSLLAAGHAGQLLVSQSTYELIRDNLPGSSEVIDLGAYLLTGSKRQEHIFCVQTQGRPPIPRALRIKRLSRGNVPKEDSALVGREK